MLTSFIARFGTYTEATADAMASFQFNYFVTLAFAAIVIFAGRAFVRHSAFLRKAALPAPVVSGLLFSIVISCIKIFGHFQISFDAATMKDFAQNMFFAGVGFAFSAGMLKKAGKKLVINIAIGAVLIITLEDLLGIGLSYILDFHPLLALQCSSASMAGGVATASAMGPFYESLGAADATVVGVAAGTCGNILASLIGGPVAVALIKRYNLKSDPNDKPAVSEESVHPLNEATMLKALAMMMLLAFLAEPITWLFGLIHVQMPVCISCIFGGALARVFMEKKGMDVPAVEFSVHSNIWLQVYLSLIMMTTDFTRLAPIAGKVLILLVCQQILLCLFCYFIAFRLFGSDYGAAVMAGGNYGWACGSATNCVANEKAIMDEYGWHSIAWDLYPSWSVICDDLYNPAILSILGSILA